MTVASFHASRKAFGLRVGALTLCLLSAAQAQSALTLNAAQYRAITGAVDSALTQRGRAPASSLAELDRARTLFGEAIPEANNSPLASGVRTALQNARIAVSRSQADLEAQTAQVRGLLRKIMHDSALEALSRAEAGAVSNVGLLADDFGVRGDARAALVGAARAGNVDLVRAQFERTAASKISASLKRANGAGRADAYLEMARATSWFSVVQDSPRTGELSTRTFVEAITSLTAGNTDAFREQLAALQSGTDRFASAASQAVRAAGRAPQQAPVQNSAPPQEPAASPATTPTTAPGAPANPAPSGPAGSAADLGAVYAPLARALVASGHGDNRAAREALADALRQLGTLPPNVGSTPEVQRLRAQVERVRDLSALRPDDVRALLGTLGNAEAARAGTATSAAESVSSTLNRGLGGPLRAGLFMLLALLAVYPLYLLNLAFGGRNPYWRAISAALVVLLLPVMLEGVASLGALLGDVTGVSALGSLANLSILQSPLGTLAWALLAALAIGLATWGFRGICLQFGLFGRRASEVPGQQPAVEWDEEL
ncbi:hypothetical protein [Deinococcus peraridilitoris]|uniref:Uncharacterized protein n=1 Tax=Deinococcus peraridilitoris (strain DSM 19664 / LMG 22246 / CIP 109416 / KR-200) TaxID=937777 RepID=L0A203_DEIPD|nr:hypothetical protein [Deinococcus peraridilitoris]AFZ67876.1 hypothetical protein Deipe_2400 [Deinococcus peraridilitoris DSM 19664]